MKRLAFIDVAKGIATVLVIIGHLKYTNPVVQAWLYTFHIPLFFFLSGYVINFDKYNNLIDFIIKKFKNTIVPYFLLSIVTWVFVECINNPIQSMDMDSFRKFLGIFICVKGTPYYLTLWFIISLFFAQIILYILNKFNNDKKMIISLVVLFFVAIYISYIYEPGWILVSDTIPMATVFLGIGFLVRKHQKWFEKIYNLGYFIVFSVLTIILGFMNLGDIARVDLYYQDLGNPLLYFVSAMCGIFMTLIFSKYFDKLKLIRYIGTNSLVFYAFHRPIFIPVVYHLIIKIESSKISYILTDNVKTMISVIFICTGLSILSIFINRYMPFLIGKSFKGGNNKCIS